MSLSQSAYSPFPLGPPSPSPSTPTPTPHRADDARATDSEAADAPSDAIDESVIRNEQSQQRPSQHGGAPDDDYLEDGSAALQDEDSMAHFEHAVAPGSAEDSYGVLGIANPMLSASTLPPLSSSLSAPTTSSSSAPASASSQSSSTSHSDSSDQQRSSTHHRRRSSFRHHLYLDEEAPDETPISRMPIAEEESRNSLSSSSSSSNTSSHLSSSSHPYERLVDELGEVKLANILSLRETKLPNPFQGDWTPVPPPNVTVDVLVACSLAQFNKPIRQVVRDMVPYVQYQPRKIRLLDYEVDEPVKARARLEQAREQQQGGKGGGKARLQDLFHSPSNSASEASKRTSSGSSPRFDPSPSPSAAASPSATESVTALRRFMDVEDGRYEDLGAATDLVDVSLLSVTLDDVQLAIRREQASSYREGLFWRFSPCYSFDPSSSADLTLVKRQAVNFWSSASQHACRFLVSIQSLRLSLGNIEPLYATLAVFDLKSEQRCSEDFHFDLWNESPQSFVLRTRYKLIYTQTQQHIILPTSHILHCARVRAKKEALKHVALQEGGDAARRVSQQLDQSRHAVSSVFVEQPPPSTTTIVFTFPGSV